jgi:2-keto-4-pentenoate hydratase
MTFEFTLYDALLSIDVPAEKARAVIDALEHDMGSTLATKQDIAGLAQATKQDIAALASATKQDIAALASATAHEFVLVRQEIQALRQEVGHRIDLLQSTMTIRLGSITVVAMGLLFAALKLT